MKRRAKRRKTNVMNQPISPLASLITSQVPQSGPVHWASCARPWARVGVGVKSIIPIKMVTININVVKILNIILNYYGNGHK
jgi:hypothetical protein